MNKKMRQGIALFLMLAILTLAWSPASPAFAADEYDGLRDKWLTTITGGTAVNTSDPQIAAKITQIESAVTNSSSTGYWDTLDKSGSRTYLWSDVASLSTQSDHIRISYQRLRDMAVALKTTGSSLLNNSALKADIISGLDWLYANYYNEGLTNQTPYDNWWDWEIGTPLQLNDAVVLLYNDLTSAQRTNYMNAVNRFTPSPSQTGANRVWKALVVAVRGVIVKDSVKIGGSRDGLSSVFNYVTSGDGFYTDGSFIQHSKFPYSGGYGTSLLQDIARLLHLLKGSTWDVTDTDVQNVYNWVYDSFRPFIYKGAMMDMVRGRQISRSNDSDHASGHKAIAAITRLTQVAPTGDSLAFKKMIKYWIQSDTNNDFYTDPAITINMITIVKSIMGDSSITPSSELQGYFQFPSMDRTVHLRPGFGLGISMYSNRIYNYEAINSENKEGWHTSDGMTYLYTSDLSQFGGDFWPTVDNYRLPGTTVLQNTKPSSGQVSDKNWVGGVDFQGTYGATGMEYHEYGTALQAKKSWFLFDDEVVAVGSGITSTDAKVIETIIENRKLNTSGSNTFKVNDETAESTSLTLGTQTYSGTNWMHLDGNVTGGSVGYFFPSSTTVKALRSNRTGSWSDLNAAGSTTSVSNKFMTLWIDHGSNPTNGSYAYVLLPNQSSTQTSAYAANPEVTILAQDTDAHAVKENTLNLVAANFWSDITKTVQVDGANYLTSNKKASVMVKESGTDIEASVSDPTQANTGTVTIEINKSANSVISNDPQVTVIQTTPTIKFTVNVNGANGKSFKVKFGLTGASSVKVDNSSSSVAYTGTWTHSSDANYYNSTKSVSNTTNSNAVLTFTGSTIRIFTKKLSAGGKFDVYIDNNFVATVDTYSATDQYQVKVYENSTLSNGSHTVKVQLAGQKNASSTGLYIGLDYFEYQ
ncbi:polysaccharide lyase 8 family protein [Paenibacillus roseipurpureus]|uniref:Polysaccharide lyase 8 family protein n=1 Tax=Paenibacillus roseopurpureus TaxID=2918901 RepID=A0AA96LMW0_9BACL|nr:polysaccharide lyase 8 family protein [Paenibacillus sp. MBLB1832]WNR44052.1 polysaccharide lyase 8 family protein [Paenibacillus sp. MBLB1832]